jgi:hypothetical protein
MKQYISLKYSDRKKEIESPNIDKNTVLWLCFLMIVFFISLLAYTHLKKIESVPLYSTFWKACVSFSQSIHLENIKNHIMLVLV